ncbi:single-stranded DNA-binding protein [Candidatus Berkelbacteria bacterium CG_4_10_14_0_8_um_filter_35_9_33_8]|uniref:Single-stranded DNA-binding protein n=1 Tax=Candidatus Berkelbacteria bacterium CG_4_10_14_0_2_um_filter_35_9_33_12 TaxID=1974499 RepID=A0A2M7W505_9BACT|nr:MAG: single-stranded DNA-binding protein [Candidatus Berkelbacteria bacterium CG23_combo_of_CG06-09_8_20_14_all_33_15]PIS08505.1 MAG: single-stranded DNA-binding protein [Candidatus Berkelbacteria bacterium CG10_big_fil_rev_8_21_14_0_10_33_10]PIZ28089.1 MAG: single-stranded DNA-binding protein [Candidatus Berkelbacteria bacterium CG_4_10_14_0_8_um_filter_35_9_33_8]PJA20460.1 MAG: single-stranded DNA-binding protein [Candidatus Berkelbacteria bacterium CG_4_10_14_0_2_um_filter_35_9_33_12]PJB5
MISLNRATIIGNLTKDPEVRYTSNGQPVANFSVATNRKYKNAQGDLQEDTEFHDVVVWNKLAEIISQFVKKGQKIYIEGRLKTRSWDAPDGSKRYKTEIITENFVPLTPKGEPSSFSYSADKTQGTSPTHATTPDVITDKINEKDNNEEINLDDIPF